MHGTHGAEHAVSIDNSNSSKRRKGKRDERGINRSPRRSTEGAERAFSGSRHSCGAAGARHLPRGGRLPPRRGPKGAKGRGQLRPTGAPRTGDGTHEGVRSPAAPHTPSWEGGGARAGSGEQPVRPAGQARFHWRRGTPGPAAPPQATQPGQGSPPQDRARQRGGVPRRDGSAAGPAPPARPGRAGPGLGA